MKTHNCYFVVNNNALRDELNRTIGNYFIETETIAGKLFALCAAVWFTSSLTIPVGGFFMRYKRLVINLGHGTPLKRFGLWSRKASLLQKTYYYVSRTNVSYTIASSGVFAERISKIFGLPLESVLIAGQPRNDQLFVKSDLDMRLFGNRMDTKNILYAPTFRSSEELRFFPFPDISYQELGDFFRQNNINIFLRPHPNFDDRIDKKLLEISHIHVFSCRNYPEIMDYLNNFDLLITDYSSIYFDYLLLDRPIVFLPYDYDSYNQETGFTVDYEEFTPGPKPSTMKDFMDALYESLYGQGKYTNDRKRVNAFCNVIQNENCKGLVDSLSQKGFISSRIL
jgi:CDP-glycerol glycerophosphotransferase